jgi:membrane protease YdiL (CAAX protease family)
MIYHLGQWAAAWSQLSFLADSDFDRFFNRSLLLAALLLLLPMMRWTGLKRFTDFGLESNRLWWRDLLAGFALTAVFVGALGVCLIARGAYVLKQHLPLNVLPQLLVSSLAVAVVEETFFRGAILGFLRRSMPTGVALLLTSLLFAIVHFLKPPDGIPTEVTWHSGFDLLPTLLFRFVDPVLVLSAGVTLFVLGLLLGFCVTRTSSLWLPIGLHAGLVFSKMGFNKLTKRSVDLLPWFGSDLTVGIGAILLLCFLWLVVWLIFRSSQLCDVQHPA